MRFVLEQIVGSQQARFAANNTVDSQELSIAPVVRIHLELPFGGGRGWEGGKVLLPGFCLGGAHPEDTQKHLGDSCSLAGAGVGESHQTSGPQSCSHPGATEA